MFPFLYNLTHQLIFFYFLVIDTLTGMGDTSLWFDLYTPSDIDLIFMYLLPICMSSFFKKKCLFRSFFIFFFFFGIELHKFYILQILTHYQVVNWQICSFIFTGCLSFCRLFYLVCRSFLI